MLRNFKLFCIYIGFAATSLAQTPEGDSSFFVPPGFSQEGKPITANAAGNGTLKIEVQDADTKKPTPCRINVVGSDGNFYQPPENHLTKYSLTGVWPKDGAWGNRPGKAPYRYLGHYFYSTGDTTLSVPPGKFRVEVWKGFEFQPQTSDVTVQADSTTNAKISLQRTAPMAAHGYYGGDLHLHFARTSDRDDATIFDLLEAEDVWFGTPLGYNEPAGPYTGVMAKMDSPQMLSLGRDSIRSRGNLNMLSGQEYRSIHFGHLNLYLLPRLVFEGQNFNLDDGPAYGVVGAEAIANGGFAIQAHGGYSKEIYADVALGAVSAVELLQFGIYREIGLNGWYDMLNSGYRFPCVGASDFPACRFMSDCRTYVRADRGRESFSENTPPIGKDSDRKRVPTPSSLTPSSPMPSFPDWLRGVAEGRSFVTTGPLLLLEVDGHHPGDVVHHRGEGARSLPVRIRVRSEVTPVSNLDLIVNGKVVKHLDIPKEKARGQWTEVEHTLMAENSCWIAARAWSTTAGGQPDAEAHTNPVYFDSHGRRAYLQQSLDRWLEKIDGQIALHTQRAFKDKANVLAYFQKARDVLLKVRQQGGVKSADAPWQLVDSARGANPVTKEPATLSDAAVGRSDITDEELREFLKPVPPQSAEDSLKSFDVAKGFHMELVAAEPLVVDPVAAAFDENGQLYVCEMRDYPFKPTAGNEPIGTVRLLRDTNGDGKFDESHVFAEKLLWAAGVVPWKGGVFVAAAPDIWYLKDTDGDHRADVRRKVFTGFGTENQQAMVNNLQLGLEQWIYGTTAGNGGVIQHVGDSKAIPVSVTRRDFRFDPVSEKFEPITGTVQFGNTFDDWGNRFTCSESQPLSHIVQPDHYLSRNPLLAASGGIQNLAPGPVPIYRISPVERWRQIRSMRRIAKNERPAMSAGASHHVIDAAAGVTIYRGGAYPSEFVGQVFVGDGQNNLVHRRILTPSGVTFQSQRAAEDNRTEFVRSSDIWFRPVNFVNAPDGTLYCLDMCREVLESIHIPLDVAKHLDFASGRNQGRIYRIAPDGFRSPPPPRLGSATTAELVAQLESKHGWWRDTAQRLICERQDAKAVLPLDLLARQSPLPQARLHALWSLYKLQSLSNETLCTALRDAHPRIREHAVRLSEPRLWLDKDVIELVLKSIDDEDPRVRYQAAFSLGESLDPRAVPALAALARKDPKDHWMRTAVLSSPPEMAAALFLDLAQDRGRNLPFLTSLATVVGYRDQPEQIRSVMNVLAKANANTSTIDPLLVELARGLKRVPARLTAEEYAGDSAAWLQSQLDRAEKVAGDSGADISQRKLGIELLGCSLSGAGRKVLLGLIAPDQPEAVQMAAVQALSDDSEQVTTEHLLASWKSLPPDVRRAVLDSFWPRENRMMELLRAALENKVSLAELDPVRREQLLKHRNSIVQKLASDAFRNVSSPSRKAVVKEYEAALKLTGNLSAGQLAFEKHCAACHQLNGKGHAIGPNLASSPSRDPQALLTHILDPNQYVLPNYVQYMVTDTYGRTFTGLIAAQTATSVTLKRDLGQSTTILRKEIEELTSTGKSLMPEELEKVLPPQAVADLIAYLQSALTKSANDSVAERDFGTLPGLIEPPSGTISPRREP